MKVQIYALAGAVRHVIASDGPLEAAVLEEIDAAGSPVALELHHAELDDGDGGPPGRMIRAGELRAAVELQDGAPRWRADAPAELRGLRLRSRMVAELPDLPDPPEPDPES